MNKKYLLLLVFFISLVSAKQVILFNFEYDNGEINLINIDKMEGFVSEINEGEYSFHLMSNNEVKEEINFKLPKVLEIVPTKEKEGKHLELEKFNFAVPVGYEGRIDEVRIVKDNEVLFEEDVTRFNLRGERISYWYYVIFALLVIVVYLVYRIRRV